MLAGRLRQRIALQSNTPTKSRGSLKADWSTFATVWAEITPTRGAERFVAGAAQQQATLTHRVRIRFRDDVTPRMRGVWETRVLDIEEVQDPDGRREQLVLICREVMEETE